MLYIQRYESNAAVCNHELLIFSASLQTLYRLNLPICLKEIKQMNTLHCHIALTIMCTCVQACMRTCVCLSYIAKLYGHSLHTYNHMG